MNEEWGTDLRKTFGSASTLIAFNALATPVPTACGDRLFFNSKKKEAKNAALKRREAGTAQSASSHTRHALACEVGCETALRAVRDGFIGWSFGMAWLRLLFALWGMSGD